MLFLTQPTAAFSRSLTSCFSLRSSGPVGVVVAHAHHPSSQKAKAWAGELAQRIRLLTCDAGPDGPSVSPRSAEIRRGGAHLES